MIPSGEGAITVTDTETLTNAIESMLRERDEFLESAR